MGNHTKNARFLLCTSLLLLFAFAGSTASFAQFELPGQERGMTTHVDKKTEERIKRTRRRIETLDEDKWKSEMNIVWFDIKFEADGKSATITTERALGFSGKKFEAAPIEGDTPQYRLDFAKKTKFKFGAPGRPEVHQMVSIAKAAGKHLLVGHHHDSDGDQIFVREVGS